MRLPGAVRTVWGSYRRLPVAGLIAAPALLVAVLGFGASWAQQSAAETALERARALQTAEVGDDDGGPPSLDAYHDILDAIDRSIEIRSGVDGLLAEIEQAVAALSSHQDLSEEIARRAASDLEEIARSLDRGARGATGAARDLISLRRALRVSARLAEAIADELEELDESLGPSIGILP